ncbi:DUF7112 family protein [Natronosalvus vescus]|uniref:DUF7112 family protein n=1 Tax=Natronosalvus vescus TaxID=2953881 RepID=UPI002091CD48|nr:hypothetical protein [Natronosalvus vescus]
MADRISSDNPSVDTIRATLAETATGVRVEIDAADAAQFPSDGGEVVRIVLDEHERFGRIDQGLMGDVVTVPGVYESPAAARDPREGVDLLPDWVDDHDVRTGGSVLVDVVEPDFLYGFRAPGETAVYDAREPPASSLQDIAKGLEDG